MLRPEVENFQSETYSIILAEVTEALRAKKPLASGTEIYGFPQIAVNDGVSLDTSRYPWEIVPAGRIEQMTQLYSCLGTSVDVSPLGIITINRIGSSHNAIILGEVTQGKLTLSSREILGAVILVPKTIWRLMLKEGLLVATRIGGAEIVYPWSLVLPGKRLSERGLGRPAVSRFDWLYPVGLERLRGLTESPLRPYVIVMGKALNTFGPPAEFTR